MAVQPPQPLLTAVKSGAFSVISIINDSLSQSDGGRPFNYHKTNHIIMISWI